MSKILGKPFTPANFVVVVVLIFFGIVVAIVKFSTYQQSYFESNESYAQKTKNKQVKPLPKISEPNIKHSNLENKTDFHNVGFSLGLINKNNGLAMLNAMGNRSLKGYLKNMVTKESDLAMINHRKFAKNAIINLYKTNEERQQDQLAKQNDIVSELYAEGQATYADIPFGWSGKLTIGTDSRYVSESINTATLARKQRLYAHLKTNDVNTHKGKIFLSWIHKDSGEVHIYNVKNISKTRNKNWVSLRLRDGWQTGSYEVAYYQFNDELVPIAQTSFTVSTVTDKSSTPKDDNEFDLNDDDFALDESDLAVL